ncbi:MAG TPA: glutamyl-tRNA reductase [Candidatus Sulfotelmatobacter sp.]|nr:glutamyl-tRNA reductase [Candidatus Sulfotelmatobacter sp.]
MSGPGLFVIGASHHQAPLEVRERLALVSEGGLRADLAAVPGLREFAVLNTCNRVEFYGVGDLDAEKSAQAAYCARQQFSAADFERIRFRLTGRDAALHLFEVASGLDSQLLGENEIFGQVKEAYAAAQSCGSTGAVLNRVFQKAFQAAKHVRTHTRISSGRVSVANVAVELACDIFGSLATARVLVLGTGEIGEGTARAFRSRGAADLAVAGRRLERVAEVACDLGASTMHFDERNSRLADYDVVVCSTAAPGAVLAASAIAAAMKERPARPLLLIDLALPRDVEPSAADLQNVFLYNLDDLGRIAERNRTAREAEIGRCKALLAQRADALWEQLRPALSAAAPGVGAPRRNPDEAGQAASP